jgi:hypothetical protein
VGLAVAAVVCGEEGEAEGEGGGEGVLGRGEAGRIGSRFFFGGGLGRSAFGEDCPPANERGEGSPRVESALVRGYATSSLKPGYFSSTKRMISRLCSINV